MKRWSFYEKVLKEEKTNGNYLIIITKKGKNKGDLECFKRMEQSMNIILVVDIRMEHIVNMKRIAS